MEHTATPRLIEASAALDLPSRALLNLWLHSGLSDEKIAAMAGLTPGAMAVRKRLIVGHLSQALEVSEDEIAGALDLITRGGNGTGAAPTAGVNGSHPAPADLGATGVIGAGGVTLASPVGPAAQETPASASASASEDAPTSTSADPRPSASQRRSGRRGWVWGLILLALAVVAIIIAVVLLAGTGHTAPHAATTGPTHGPSPTAGTPSATASTATVAPPVAAPAASTSAKASPPPKTRSARHTATSAVRPGAGPRRTQLVALSVRDRGSLGSALITGSGVHLTLDLSVRDLLRLPQGFHYVAWLYNSIIDSQRLGLIRRGSGARVEHLPADARRFREIDISIQPPGSAYNSGESALRGPNPLR